MGKNLLKLTLPPGLPVVAGVQVHHWLDGQRPDHADGVQGRRQQPVLATVGRGRHHGQRDAACLGGHGAFESLFAAVHRAGPGNLTATRALWWCTRPPPGAPVPTLPMRRLEAASREAFGGDLDGERVRALVRHALGDTKDASVRAYVFEAPGEPATMVTVKAPAEMATPQRLQSAHYQRPDAHVKHVTTDQGHYRRHAQRNGFDDSVLVGPNGGVSESTLANIGFFGGAAVVWPDAPMLHGITMQLHPLQRLEPSTGRRRGRRRSPTHHGNDQGCRGGEVEHANRGKRQQTKRDQRHHHRHHDAAPAAADRHQPDSSQQHGQGEHAEHAHAVGLDEGGTQLAFRSPPPTASTPWSAQGHRTSPNPAASASSRLQVAPIRVTRLSISQAPVVLARVMVPDGTKHDPWDRRRWCGSTGADRTREAHPISGHGRAAFGTCGTVAFSRKTPAKSSEVEAARRGNRSSTSALAASCEVAPSSQPLRHCPASRSYSVFRVTSRLCSVTPSRLLLGGIMSADRSVSRLAGWAAWHGSTS